MGIVVSEEGNMGGPTEQQKIDMIAAENDYGLVMATLDQISVFLGSWWTSSLMGRILVTISEPATRRNDEQNQPNHLTRPSKVTRMFPCSV